MENSFEKELNRSISQNRRDFIQIVVDQEEELTELLEDLKTEINDSVQQHSSGNKINDRDEIVSDTRTALKGYTTALTALLVGYNLDTFNLILDRDSQNVERFNRSDFNTRFYNRADTVSSRFDNAFLTRKSVIDGVAIGTRIKTIEKSFLNSVISAIEVGINKGESAENIARQIDSLIVTDPANRLKGPFQLYRERFSVKRVDPKLLKGSVSYNSLRIARTELIETYRNSTILLNQGMPWTKGFQWKLSPAHTRPDICDKYKNIIFKTLAERPYTHPNCMCYLIVVYYTVAEMKRMGLI